MVAEREEMEEVVAQGHMRAQMKLGDIYGFGDGVAQDDGRAFELTRQAAQQGCFQPVQPRGLLSGRPGVRTVGRPGSQVVVQSGRAGECGRAV